MSYRTSLSAANALIEARVRVEGRQCRCGCDVFRVHKQNDAYWLDCAACDGPAMLLTERAVTFITAIAQQPGAPNTPIRLQPSQARPSSVADV
jgi:hypothetical protein